MTGISENTPVLKAGKNFNIIARLLITLLICLPGNPHMSAASETIYLTNGEWPPYYGKNLPHQGFDSHIVSEAFALMNVIVVYKFFNWERAYSLAGTDRYDGGVGGGKGPEFQKECYVSDPYSDYSMVFFHRRDYPFEWEKYDDLKNLRMGLTSGYDYPDELKTMADSGAFHAERVATDELNFRKLLKGRIDIFPNNRLVGISQMKKIFTPKEIERIKWHRKHVYQDTIHLLLSKKKEKNIKMMELFNEGLKLLKQSGRYDAIRQAALRGEYNLPSEITK